MNSESALPGPFGDLDALSDGQLRALRAQIGALLEKRARDRQAEALSQIRRLAREHGLDIAVQAPARKRGRPPQEESRTTAVLKYT